jgi:hypothetical protein
MQKDARNPSKSQAEIHNITSVEPFGIVYAAVLVRCFSTGLVPVSIITDPAGSFVNCMGPKGSPLRLQGVYRATFQSVQGWRQSVGGESA